MRLALHGFTETDQLWAEALAPLGPGTRCALLPGHGWAPCPAGTTLAGAAAALPLRGGDLIGYSMGGRLALQAALDFPAQVRRLVLVSCHAGLRSERERELRRRQDARVAAIIEEDGLGAFVAWWQANPALRPARPQPRDEQQRLRGVRLGQDPRGLAAALRCLGAGAMDDLWPRLGALDLPVLLVAGAADAAYRERLAEMARLLPRARFEVVPDAGHAVHREQPAALAALVHRFLAG
jgi:2-succinyl-6-hydroxy-2,4-cyclohexadiene-1-carboxylate synthase